MTTSFEYPISKVKKATKQKVPSLKVSETTEREKEREKDFY